MDALARWWYWFVAWFVRECVFRLTGGIELIGLERVPREGPLLVCPIHVSHMDPPAVGCSCPRRLSFMAKKELFFPPLGWLIASLGSFPVSRGSGDTTAIRRAVQILKDGGAVLMFPEGTRGDGTTLGAIQSGVAMLAKREGVRIVPVGIGGSAKMLPKGRTLPRRARLRVVYGEPFSYSEVVSAGAEKDAFARALGERMAAAAAEAGLQLRFER